MNTSSDGLQRLLTELAQCVVAALEQLARDRQAGSVRSQPLGGLGVVIASGEPVRLATWAASNSAQRNAGGPWRERCPGARR